MSQRKSGLRPIVLASLFAFTEKGANALGVALVAVGHGLQVGHRRAAHALGRAEAMQQRLLPPHAHACDLIQRVLPHQRGGSFRPD